MGMVGQVGDWCESLLKRSAKIKDAASILPGHGGILDRLDSLLFNAPILYYYYRFFWPS
jgi:phosphatidate cytidylyltransferase